MKTNNPTTLIITLLCTPFFNFLTFGQLAVTASTDYTQLVNNLSGSGVSVSNVTFTGSSQASGIYSNGGSSNLGSTSGVVLSTGIATDVDNGFTYNGSSDLLVSGNTLIGGLSGGTTFDAAVLEFDVVPSFDTLVLNYIYGSEDYPEWVGGNAVYQDHFGVFVSGSDPDGGSYTDQNFALVPNTSLPIVVNNINAGNNQQYFVSNISSSSVMYDGFTTLLQIKIPVVPAASYHLKIAIADGGDQTSDSGVFLEDNSLMSYSSSAGLGSIAQAEQIGVYPNPAQDLITVTTTEKGRLCVKDQLGQQLLAFDIESDKTQLSLAHLPSGVYFIVFQSEKDILMKTLIVR